MKLLIVIVNYRTPGLTLDCLKSLVPEINTVSGGVRVVIADNASGDDSVAQIQQAIDANNWTWATMMPLAKNGGFAYGNNEAIRPALASSDPPQYVYLLNPDTIVLPDALKELTKFMDSRPDVGIAGGKAVGEDGTLRISAFKFHTPLSELEGSVRLGLISKILRNHIVATPSPDDVPSPVDWVAGASMIIRRDVFEKIGLLDEKYFMYYEETDFCMRARQAGFPCWFVPSSKIIHLIGASSGVTCLKRVLKRRPRYWFESRHHYFRQHFGLARTILADVLWAGGFAVHKVLDKLRRRPRQDPPWLLWDFIRYNVTLWGHRP